MILVFIIFSLSVAYIAVMLKSTMFNIFKVGLLLPRGRGLPVQVLQQSTCVSPSYMVATEMLRKRDAVVSV